MNRATTPIGWGYAPESKTELHPAAERERRHVKPDRKQSAADKIPLTPRRRNRMGQRKTHMRFALWAQALGRDPNPGEICDTFDVHWETACSLIADWKTITKEQP